MGSEDLDSGRFSAKYFSLFWIEFIMSLEFLVLAVYNFQR